MNFTAELDEIEKEAVAMYEGVKMLHLSRYTCAFPLRVLTIREVLHVQAAKIIQRQARGMWARRRAAALRRMKTQQALTERFGVFCTASFADFDDFFVHRLSSLPVRDRAEHYRVARLLFGGLAAFRGCQFRYAARKPGLKPDEGAAAGESWDSDETW